jgi:hypothetical protein
MVLEETWTRLFRKELGVWLIAGCGTGLITQSQLISLIMVISIMNG